MNEQYGQKQCDICHQSSYDGSPMIVVKCQHRYHRKCLPVCDDINNTQCPICPDENKSLLSITTQQTNEEDNVSDE